MPYLSLINEQDHNNEFILSHYGGYKGFLCIGDSAFIDRCVNLFYNQSFVTYGEIKEYYERDRKGVYILIGEETLKQKLAVYFQWEILQERKADIDFKEVLDEEGDVIDVTWDEDKQKQLAWERTFLFLEDIMKRENLLTERREFEDHSSSFYDIGSSHDKNPGFTYANSQEDNWTNAREEKREKVKAS